MKPDVIVVYAASVATFLGVQVLLWHVQPGSCTFVGMLDGLIGCQATTILYVLHLLAAFLAAILVINFAVWWRKRKNRKQDRL